MFIKYKISQKTQHWYQMWLKHHKQRSHSFDRNPTPALQWWQWNNKWSTSTQTVPTDRYCSIALCTRNTVQAIDLQYFPRVNGIKFTVISTTTQLSSEMLILYWKNRSNISHYIQDLKNIVNSYAIDIIMGDFNMNYLNDDTIEPLKTLMNSLLYSQLVQGPTFVSEGSTLDQVYIKPTHDIVQNSIISVYYSDHDAVKISIKHK